MRRDNKVMVFTGRNEGEVETIFGYDSSIRKEIAWGGETDYPRVDEDDGNVFARDSIDHDYSSARDDVWLWRRSATMDLENEPQDSVDYYLNDNREPEDPDKYYYDATPIGGSSDGEEV